MLLKRKVTKGDDHHQARAEMSSNYGTNFNIAPWFDLDRMKQYSIAVINATSELQKVLDKTQNKQKMLPKYEAIYYHNSEIYVIDSEEEEEDSSEALSEEVPEIDKAELRRRMLGHF